MVKVTWCIMDVKKGKKKGKKVRKNGKEEKKERKLKICQIIHLKYLIKGKETWVMFLIIYTPHCMTMPVTYYTS